MSIFPISAQIELNSVTLVGNVGAIHDHSQYAALKGIAYFRKKLTSDAVKVGNTKNINVAALGGARRADWQLAVVEHGWESEGAGEEAAKDED